MNPLNVKPQGWRMNYLQHIALADVLNKWSVGDSEMLTLYLVHCLTIVFQKRMNTDEGFEDKFYISFAT